MLNLYDRCMSQGIPIDRRLSEAFANVMLDAWRNGKLPARSRGRKKATEEEEGRQRRAALVTEELAGQCGTLTEAFELAVGRDHGVPFGTRSMQRHRAKWHDLVAYATGASPILVALGIEQGDVDAVRRRIVGVPPDSNSPELMS